MDGFTLTCVYGSALCSGIDIPHRTGLLNYERSDLHEDGKRVFFYNCNITKKYKLKND